MRRIRPFNLLGSSEDFDCVTLKFTWFSPPPKGAVMFQWPPSLPTPPHGQLIGSQFCIVPTFNTLSATTDTPLPKEKSFVPIVSLNCFEALNYFLLFCLSVFRVFPLEWTESNPTFLLTLLDQFNIEGKEEIKDLFVKVGSKAIFSNSCH